MPKFSIASVIIIVINFLSAKSIVQSNIQANKTFEVFLRVEKLKYRSCVFRANKSLVTRTENTCKKELEMIK